MVFLHKTEGLTRQDVKHMIYAKRTRWFHKLNHRIQQNQLHYFGHITRIKNSGFPKQAIEGCVHRVHNVRQE